MNPICQSEEIRILEGEPDYVQKVLNQWKDQYIITVHFMNTYSYKQGQHRITKVMLLVTRE